MGTDNGDIELGSISSSQRSSSSHVNEDTPLTPQASQHAPGLLPGEVPGDGPDDLELDRDNSETRLQRSLSTPRLKIEAHTLFTERTAREDEQHELAHRLKRQFNRRGSIYRAPSQLQQLDKDALLSKAEEMHRKMETEIDAYTAFTEVPLEQVDDPMNVLVTHAQKVEAKTALKDIVFLLGRVNFYSVLTAALLFGVLMYKSEVVFQMRSPSANRRKPEWVDFYKVLDATLMTGSISASPAIIVLSMFGWQRSKDCFKYGLPIVYTVNFVAWMIPLVLDTEGGIALGTLRPVPAFLCTLMSIFLFAYYMEKYQFIPHFTLKFSASLVAIFVVVVVYFYIIPELWFSTSSDLMRVALRIFVHPLLFETAGYITRASVRNLRGNHPSTTYVILIYVMAFNALYGRFLVSASSSSMWTVITAAILSAEEIFLRLSVGARDKLLYGLRHTPEEVRARFHTIRSVRLRADLLYVDVYMENTAIIMSSFTVWIFSVGGITLERALQDMALQLALEFFTDLFVLYIESRQMNIPVYEAWQTRNWVHEKPFFRRLYFFLPLTFILAASFSYFITAYFDPLVGFVSRQSI
eukprot:TRINITY_DN1406_c0_g1_i4.p1 TRINITY_DN1406_c0_g1~~TRINITY_DN1406_c0_g1_i4.p1  ORF type:complete len:582 (-),score=114.14 TRINITY_DN1406_c0_g1_i4:111-1856(-)